MCKELKLEYLFDETNPLVFNKEFQQVSIWEHTFTIKVIATIGEIEVKIDSIIRNWESIEIEWHICIVLKINDKITLTKEEIKKILYFYNEKDNFRLTEEVNWFEVNIFIEKLKK